MASVKEKPTKSSEGMSLSFEDRVLQFNDFGISVNLAEKWTEKKNIRDAWTVKKYESLGLEGQTLDKFGRFVILSGDLLDKFSREGRTKYQEQKHTNEKFTELRNKLDSRTTALSIEGQPSPAEKATSSTTKRHGQPSQQVRDDFFTEAMIDQLIKDERLHMHKINAMKGWRHKNLFLTMYIHGKPDGKIYHVTCTVFYEGDKPLLIFRSKHQLSAILTETLNEGFHFELIYNVITCHKPMRRRGAAPNLTTTWTLRALDSAKAKTMQGIFIDHRPSKNGNSASGAALANGHNSLGRQIEGKPCGKLQKGQDNAGQGVQTPSEEKMVQPKETQSEASGQKHWAPDEDVSDGGDGGNRLAIPAPKKTGRCRDRRKKKKVTKKFG